MITAEDIIRSSREVDQKAGGDGEDLKDEFGLELGALMVAAVMETMQTLATTLELLTLEEQQDEGLWGNTTALTEQMLDRLREREVTPEQLAGILAMQFESGVLTGLQLAKEGGS